MILTVNAENSKIYIGCADEASGDFVFVDIVSTDIGRSSAEYAITFEQVLKLNKVSISGITGCIIASCVPPVTDTLKAAIRKLIDIDIIEVGPGVKTGVDIRIDDPGELGADLIVSAAAALEEYGAPLIVITLGTVTVYSVINEKMQFAGAVFQPGIRLSAEAVSRSSANLPDTAVRPSPKIIGTNTKDSIRSGIFNGCAASIDGLIGRIEEELGVENINVVINGEFSTKIAAMCKRKIVVDEHLNAKGLMLIYKKNHRHR